MLDGTVFRHPTVLEALVKGAREKRIVFRFKKVPVRGREAGAIRLTKADVPSGTVAVPCSTFMGLLP